LKKKKRKEKKRKEKRGSVWKGDISAKLRRV
jgi:hypothetical protein